jgi:hypothetical protein
MTEFSNFWFLQLAQLPVYLVLLVGMLLAGINWRKHPRVSLLAMVGIGLILISALVASFLGSSLPLFLHTRGLPARFMGTVLLVVNLARSLITATGWVLILWALFGWRRETSFQS